MRTAYSYTRFSTKDQLKGDSQRRQDTDTDRACLQHQWKLSDLIFRDPGVSGFRGKNQFKGKLASFLELMEAGQLDVGAILILEDFDRLSRTKMMGALDLVRRILEGGIEIFCTLNWRLYGRESLNDPMSIMEMLWRFYLSHEESQKKSVRSKANWQAKQDQALEKIMTKKCPAWLQMKFDRSGWDKLTLRVNIVKRIFQMCIDGKGIISIEHQLNKEGVPPWKTSWNQKVIYEILTDGRVLGDLPTKEYGDVVKKGKVIKGYYPAIIDEATYQRANNAIKSRKLHSGRKPKGAFLNLFTGLVRYPAHDSSMVYLSKPKGGRPYRYLASFKGFKGLQPYVAIPYDRFEEVLIHWLYELNPNDFTKLAETNEDDEELTFLDNRIKEMADALDGLGVTVPEVMEKISAMTVKRNAVRERIEERKRRQVSPTVRETQETLLQLMTLFQTNREIDQRVLMEKIRQRLLLLLDRIDVTIEGKRVFCRILFKSGVVRGVWYEGDSSGLWSPDGTFSGADLDHFTRNLDKDGGKL